MHYVSVSVVSTLKFIASSSILTGILSAPGARSTYPTLTGCSLNLVPLPLFPRYLRGSSKGSIFPANLGPTVVKFLLKASEICEDDSGSVPSKMMF